MAPKTSHDGHFGRTAQKKPSEWRPKVAPRCPEAFRGTILGQKVQKIVTSAKQKHIKFERNFVEKSKPTPIKRQATTHHAQHTTHDIQHTTRPIEFTRATRSTSIFTTRQEAAETSHMQHATYIAENMRRGGEFPSWGRERGKPFPFRERVCRIVRLRL